MSKPTPEEAAIYNALLSLYCWVYDGNKCPAETKIFKIARETIDTCIARAVAAERKRCEAEWEQERRDLIGEIQEARTYGGTWEPHD
jgi:hypothetical protein